MNCKEIIIANITPGYMPEKTEEELLKIVTLDDIQEYFSGVVKHVTYFFEREPYTEYIGQAFIAAMNEAYTQLTMHRNTKNRKAMQNIFKNNLSIIMHCDGTLNITFPRIIIDDKTNTFIVKRPCSR